MSVLEFVKQLDTLLAASKGADSWTDSRLSQFTAMFDKVEAMWTSTRKETDLRGDVLNRADRQVSLIRSELNAVAAKRKARPAK